METYYGVIYFKNGRIVKTGGFSGPGAARSCEIRTAQMFEQYKKTAISAHFEPSRYEVKCK